MKMLLHNICLDGHVYKLYVHLATYVQIPTSYMQTRLSPYSFSRPGNSGDLKVFNMYLSVSSKFNSGNNLLRKL